MRGGGIGTRGEINRYRTIDSGRIRGRDTTRNILNRSVIGTEFKIKAGRFQKNSFINVCLQTLWKFPKVRAELCTIANASLEECPAETKPLVASLQNFYKDLIR